MIPIYRAKKIDSDEYVEGKLIEDYGIGFYIQINNSLENIATTYGDYGFSTNDFEQIDSTTLSIHFPDMLDTQGNKIFASLNEDGKGGDILYYEDECEPYVCEHSSNGTLLFEYLDNKTIKNFICRLSSEAILFRDLKVIGIQE